MASHSSSPRRDGSPDPVFPPAPAYGEQAPGRLYKGPPVGVVDIGSNSVRLVVYEALTRAPTPIFNEKVLCGLGRSIASTGRLDQDAIAQGAAGAQALPQARRPDGRRPSLGHRHGRRTRGQNGEAFLDEARAICRVEIEVISGQREAQLSALGVVSGFWKPDGIVGDLGGGSLELIDVGPDHIGAGLSLPLGGLRLIDASGRSLKKAEKIVRDEVGRIDLSAGEGRAFYAVGGTWRALARLHMKPRRYPLHVMHAYEIPPKDVVEFARAVERADPETLAAIETVSAERRPLLAYGAMVLEHVVRAQKPSKIVISALGVREGLLHSLLDDADKGRDPLLTAAEELAILRSRSPTHARELVHWTDGFFADVDPMETAEERRLRHAACLLADIGWRAHPDYRGEQSLGIIAHAAFTGVDHPGRTFLALSVYYRHAGLVEDELAPSIRALASPRSLSRARVLGAALRVAYLVTASMPGVLPKSPLRASAERVTLTLSGENADLSSERVLNRLRGLSKLVGKSAAIVD